MSNLKISQLPEYTGNTNGTWLIMNNSGETTTYKVKKENWVFPYNGTATITGSLNVSSSFSTTNYSIINGVGIGNRGLTGVGNIGLGGYNLWAGPGNNNIGIGVGALERIISGSGNIGLGQFSGRLNTNGSYNLNIGSGAGWYNTGSNKIYIDMINGPRANNNDEISGSIIYGDQSGTTQKLRLNAQVAVYSGLTVENGNVNLKGNTTVSGSLIVSGSGIRVTGSINSLGSITTTDGAISAGTSSVAFLTPTGEIYATETVYLNKIQTVYSSTGSLTIFNTNANKDIILETNTGNVLVTGSVNISSIMNLRKQNTLPAGTTGSLAVSGSGLYFHNGTSWVLIS